MYLLIDRFKTGCYLGVSDKCSYSRPPQYCRSVDRLPAADVQVPNMFLFVIYDPLYSRFHNTAAFSPVPRAAVLGGRLYIIISAGLHKDREGDNKRPSGQAQ